MEQSKGGNFDFPPDKELQSDIDTPAATSSSSAGAVHAAKKLARQLDFTVSGARGVGDGGGLTSTTASILQTQHMRVPVPAPAPRSQTEMMMTAVPQMPLMPPLPQAHRPRCGSE